MVKKKNFGEQFGQLTDSLSKIDCPVFGNLLGLSLPTDEIPLIFSEGLSCVLAGMTKCVVTDLQLSPTGDVQVLLDEKKIEAAGFDRNTWTFYGAADVPTSIHGAKIQPDRAIRRVQFASAVSVPGNVVNVKYGMADVTAFALVLALVMKEFINNGAQALIARAILAEYKKLLAAFAGIGELPLTGGSGFKTKVDAGDFVAKNVTGTQIIGIVKQLAQKTGEFVNGHFVSQVDCEIGSFADASLSGFDFTNAMTDQAWLETLLDTGQMPVTQQAPPPPPSKKKKSHFDKFRTVAAASAAKSVRPAFLDDASLQPAAKQMMTARYLRSGNGGCFHQLMIGPPSTGKSTIAKYAKDLPGLSVSFSATGDRNAVLGNFASTIENNVRVFVPVLGKMTEVWRSGMLLALRAALRRGTHSVENILKEFAALPVTETLANLVKSPTDPDRLREFEALADPTDQESWTVVQRAYFQSGAADIGATVRFNVEEIFHSAANRDVQNLLTSALDDRRELDPSVAGFSCATLYGYNVQVVATGNPDLSSPLTGAIKSRFSSLAYVGIPGREEKRKRARSGIDLATKAADGERLIDEPLSLRLEDAIGDPEFVKPTALSERAENAILDFVEWTEVSYNKLEMPSYLDGRAINQMFLTAGVYQTWGESPKSAVTKALEPLLYSMAVIDHKGLPIQEKLETIRSKAESYFKSL